MLDRWNLDVSLNGQLVSGEGEIFYEFVDYPLSWGIRVRKLETITTSSG